MLWATAGNDLVAATTAGDIDARFRDLLATFQPAVARLCRANEADADGQHDLAQEIWVALWRSLPGFEGRSSLRTWVYRIAHNVAASHVSRGVRDRNRAPLCALDDVPVEGDADEELDRRALIERIAAFTRRLRPIDRQVIVLFLEGVDQPEIAEITGLSVTHVSTKVHRIRALLSRRFQPRPGGHEKGI